MASHILKRFRDLMALKNISIYVLPRTDEHQSEYLCPCDERVSFLSGFTGSNALALVSQSEALVWTDGRYFLQAQHQLQEGWKMKKMMEGEKKWYEHIAQTYQPAKTNIQIDGNLISAQAVIKTKDLLQNRGFKINFSKENIVDNIWQNRPSSSQTLLYPHQKWAGKTLNQKVAWIRSKINDKNGQGALFTDLGQVAWILNLRSSEIPYNPFFKSILVITKEGGTLYLPKFHQSLQDRQIIEHLSNANIQLKPYDSQFPLKLLCQKNKLNYSVYSQLKEPIQWDGIGLFRAVRTQKQIEGFRRCHLADGIAMAKFWSWRSEQSSVNQFEAAQKMNNLRREQKDNKGFSFATISAGGPNGAIIHYHPTKQKNSIVTNDMIHLVDSGGQYLDGTTDVTRAFHFGSPTSAQKDAYTRVLLGNLDIQRLKWPITVKLTGMEIDVLAKRHLWKKGLDFIHGTGHGVGYFGGVHEGPVGISRINKTILEKNMIVTNQPGYYQSGKFGIRIENMLVVRQVQTGILGFQNFTLCPYDKNLIDLNLLTKEDILFINDYHDRVWNMISPHLEQSKFSRQWLRKATSPMAMI